MSTPRLIALHPSADGLEGRDDDQLMQLACAGVEAAFALLVVRYQNQVRSYCMRKCKGSAATGDDVAQDVFTELWRTRSRYQPRGKFRAYLFRIAHTRALHAATRCRPCDELPDQAPADEGDFDRLLEAERVRRVQHKLALLPEKLREAILLRFAAGLDFHEMAQILARPEATARSRVFHGILRLRELLAE
jgi:RNA polymerase sigma-70 factor (ECF subfamily)